MKIPFIFNRKTITLSLLCISCMLLTLAISGCGEDYSSSYDQNDLSYTGSYACSLKWPEDVPTLETTSIVSRGIDCDATGVATVTFTFYDESGSYLTGDEWSCSLHQGTVDGIPAGTNRRLVVTGEDASGAMLYWGEETGIMIVAGQTTQGGEIEMEYVYGTVPSIPTNVVATAGDQQVTISWDTVTGATSYNIYWSISSGVTKGEGTKISNVTSPYTHTGLTNDTTYYYVVTAENSYGESDESNEVSATPSAISLGMTFELIPAGTFTMGSPTDELGRDSDEAQHQVTLTKDFYIQTTEVTQGQWKAVMGSNPSGFSDCGDDCPVEYVSWDDVQEFIEKLNEMEGTDKYRLPTEAEWEYASRAGTTTAFANGGITEIGCDYDPNLDAIGWYCGNSDDKTHPVAQKDPNAWGLYDMHGNVWEWCQDWYGEDYPSSPVTDPTGPSSGAYRVFRGGSWSGYAGYCRSADRGGDNPVNRSRHIGFRVARNF